MQVLIKKLRRLRFLAVAARSTYHLMPVSKYLHALHQRLKSRGIKALTQEQQPEQLSLLSWEITVTIRRRDFLRTAFGATAASVLSGCGSSLPSTAAPKLPSADRSAIEHIVVVMMENRSFDHFLGWLPNADGKQAGLSYVDPTAPVQHTYHLWRLQWLRRY